MRLDVTKRTWGECCDVGEGRRELHVVVHSYIFQVSDTMEVEIAYDKTYRRRVLYCFKENRRAREEIW